MKPATTKSNQRKLEYLRNQRRVSRELQQEAGIVHKASVYKDRTKYDRKDKSWKKDID